MSRLKLMLALVRAQPLLGTTNAPLPPPGEGQRKSPGRCPKHRITLEKHLRGYWCSSCERYIPKASRLP
jgi:hypothetical protein